ncbi:uncharacterized protein THITE_2054227 [Thermothielavioides terrestris NRRL 8126]|uniref:Uncharacterized protein n=1 Tax=Thermothielavioides terrestris (strain ATCC 38088 / NRRL 8126) TaxID=578455 RepID=G2RAM7_THETT|nr:uncharacterized protein THITE_2054227 [Thermothielavioides terrestris NRRL 8126]AEO68905.1 hypothetical protein THITE_2054227 [Thermothielavioides terrestris NRRL 8126]
MSQKPISPLLRAWYKWKMLRLPWRRQFLVGLDLNGNTYWEFLDRGSRLPSPNPAHPHLSPVRWRRIVRCPRGTPPDALVVPPAWHGWLRHTRADPPSLAEQRAEEARQARVKQLAAEADARWEAKPRVATGPAAGGASAVLGVRAPALETERRVGPGSKVKKERGPAVAQGDTLGDREAVDLREETWRRMRREAEAKGSGTQADPWKQARGGPSETWQPQAWQPAAKPKK